MGSKINPIRLRLGSYQFKDCWYQIEKLQYLDNFWEKNKATWKKGLLYNLESSQINNLKLYIEKQQSLKRYWLSAWSGLPSEKKYQDCFHLDLIIRRLIEASFLKINFIAYNSRVSFCERNTQLKIQVFIFPARMPKKNRKIDLELTQNKLVLLIQQIRGLKTNLIIIDTFSLLASQKEKIKFRSDRAENFGLARLNPNDEAQKWLYQLINSLFLLKRASLLAKFISLELPKVKKRHVFWLRFLEKTINSFWKLNLQRNQSAVGFSFFSQTLVGIRVQVKGRLNGQDRKQKTSFSVGRLSLQELDVSVDFASSEVLTRYGVFGVKVWIALVSNAENKRRMVKKRKVLSNKKRLNQSLFNEPSGW